MTNVRVRFAPSPTGNLHIGSIRSAIFNWLYARHTNGVFLLRIEDTDVQRSTQAFLDSQLASLKWFGLESQEPLVYQLSRAQEHRNIAQELIAQGLAYRCFCTARNSEDVVAQLDKGVGHVYDKACRNKKVTEEDLQKPYAIRFKIPDNIEMIAFNDVIRGKISIKADQLDDFIIVRSDGTPIYNFCVVVDDIYQRITHILRGEEHIPNTFKQVLIYRALGAQEPVFAHVPLILGKSGNKLSKRDASVSVDEYRVNGYMPEALLNYLVRLGWSHGDQEIFTQDELIQFFELKDIGKKGAIFDSQKLDWVNSMYIRNASYDRLLECFGHMSVQRLEQLKMLWSQEELVKLIEQYKQRAVTLRQLSDDIIALAYDPENYDLSAIAKWRTDNTKKLLEDFINTFVACDKTGLSCTLLQAQAQELCAQYSEKLVNLAQPLRLALTGKIQSPGVFELIEILGKEKALKRINALNEKL
ncbi:MAG: glutamate--tRNA ligase [bacterium]